MEASNIAQIDMQLNTLLRSRLADLLDKDQYMGSTFELEMFLGCRFKIASFFEFAIWMCMGREEVVCRRDEPSMTLKEVEQTPRLRKVRKTAAVLEVNCGK